jgi:hypothetical protein
MQMSMERGSEVGKSVFYSQQLSVLFVSFRRGVTVLYFSKAVDDISKMLEIKVRSHFLLQ